MVGWLEGGGGGEILSPPHQREEVIDVCRSFKSKCRKRKEKQVIDC